MAVYKYCVSFFLYPGTVGFLFSFCLFRRYFGLYNLGHQLMLRLYRGTTFWTFLCFLNDGELLIPQNRLKCDILFRPGSRCVPRRDAGDFFFFFNPEAAVLFFSN